MVRNGLNLSATMLSAKALCSQQLTSLPSPHIRARSSEGGVRTNVCGPARMAGWGRSCILARSAPAVDQALTPAGSSTIEKRTPALCRFSSDTSRQHSSASLRVLNGPLTWAEPSTSLWKFIEPNSPPITQKLLPLVIVSLLLPGRPYSAAQSIQALVELVHRVVGAARLQGRRAGEVSLVIVADVGAGHVLMLCTGDGLPDFLALNVLHIAKHALFAEVILREIVRRQSRRVIGRQRDQVVEDARALG